MSFHHRKLLNDSFDDSISKICQPYCVDLTQNKDGSCPILCLSKCFPICNQPLFDDPPPPPPPTSVAAHPSKSFGLSVFLTITLAVLSTAFFVFFCYTVYKFYKGWRCSRRRRQQQQPPAQPQGEEDEVRLDFLDEAVVDHPIWYIRTVGLQPSVISAITICKYKKGDGLVEGTECSVCLNEFQEDETLRLLPKCNHAFHIPCIDTWLRSHTNCPLCRAGIMINTASLQSSGQSNSDSGRVEETQWRVSENITGRDWENGQLQERVTIEVEDEQELRTQNVLKRDEEDVAGNSCAREGDGIQPIRRSVSMDSLSASMISSAITNAFPVYSDRRSDKQGLEMNGTSTTIALKRVDTDQNLSKSDGSFSDERSLQKGSSSSMGMRSLSCSAKVFLSRYSRSRSSVPLPRSF